MENVGWPDVETSALADTLASDYGAGAAGMIVAAGWVTRIVVTIGLGRGAPFVDVSEPVGRFWLDNGIGRRMLDFWRLFEIVSLTCRI